MKFPGDFLDKKIAIIIAALSFDKIMRIGSALLILILIARNYGPEVYGKISYAISIVAIFEVLTIFGADRIVVREVRYRASEYLEIVAAAFFLRVTLSVVILTALFLISINYPDLAIINSIVVVMATVIFFKSYEVFKYYFEAQGQLTSIIYSEAIITGVFLVPKIWVISTQKDYHWYLYMLPVESFVLMLFGVVKYIKKTKCKPIGIVKFNSKEIKYLLNESWPLLISAFAWLLATKSNQFIIERYVDNYWLGQYSAAMQLSDIFNIFPVIVGVAMMPKALKNKGNKEAYFNIFKTIYRICIAYSLVVIVLISMGADNLTVLLLGEKYLDSVKFLKISVFSILFTSLITINGYYFIAEGRQWVLMQRHIMFAAMNVCGNIFLIPGYGVEVGMYYTLLLYMFHSIILDFIGVKNKKLNNVKVSELLMRWMWK